MLLQIIAQRIYNPQIIEPIQNFSGWQYLQRLYPIFIILGFIISVVIFLLIIIIGGIQWITSGGERSAVDNARRKVINGITGLAILLLVFFAIVAVGRIFGVNLLGSFKVGTSTILTTPTSVPGAPTSTPSVSIDEEFCLSSGGIWTELGTSCGDNCVQSGCINVVTWACDCGDFRCWLGGNCVPNPSVPTATTVPPGPIIIIPSPTSTPYPTSTPIPTATPTIRPTNTPTPRPTNTPTPTSTPTPRPTSTPTPTPRPTNTPIPTPTPCAPAMGGCNTMLCCPGLKQCEDRGRCTCWPIDQLCPNVATPTPTPIPLFCNDSDGGQSYYQQGTVTDNTTLSGGRIEYMTDYCSSGTLLNEYFCNGVYRSQTTDHCSSITGATCFNGECCGWVNQGCSTDSDCCTNYACQGGKCVSPTILLNEAFNMSCYNYCIDSGFLGCISIGTDALASNGMTYIYPAFVCTLTNTYTCNTVVYISAPGICGGHQAEWTRCRCLAPPTVSS